MRGLSEDGGAGPAPGSPVPFPGDGVPASIVRTRPRAVFIGLPGAGKSTIGRRVSRALGVPFDDTDVAIETREGGSCGEIFTRLGEERFREIEEEEVAATLRRADGVVSLGGGAVLSPRTRALLRDHVVVYLEISAAEGVRRTRDTATRPVLAAADPEAHYRALVEVRRPLYEEVAVIRVTTERRNPGRVAREIVDAIAAIEEGREPASSGAAATATTPPDTPADRSRS